MNDSRKERIINVIEALDEQLGILGLILDEEAEDYEALSEEQQSSELGEISEQVQECLENALDSLGDILVDLEEITQ